MNRLALVAGQVLLSAGWARVAIAFLAGGLAALALAPHYLWPLLAVSLALLVWLLDGAEGPSRFGWTAIRIAFATGWCWGFGFFLAGLWWLGAAFLVETDEFLWALPLGVLGLPAALALFPALGCVFARWFWAPGWGRVAALAAGLGGAEWARGHLFTGFPWNALGQVFAASDASLQAASILGLEGLTFLAILVGASVATLADQRGRWGAPLVAALVLGLLVTWGIWRLGQAESGMVPEVSLRIMQPNISQRDKHRLQDGPALLARYLALSERGTRPDQPRLATITHLIWPESPFPFLLAREPRALAQIAGALAGRTTLITGAIRAEDGATPEATRYFNAIHVVGADGIIRDSYDKTHLVPFGEYLPLQDVLSRLGLRQFVRAPGGFTAGSRRRVLLPPAAPPAAPLICYEAIFPALGFDPSPRPGWIVTVTNDGWFGRTIGPAQHLEQARMRAVEHGLPVVRAANTGISAVIDSHGRIRASLPLGVEGVVDSGLPKAAPPTLYVRMAGVIAPGLFLFCTLLALSAALILRPRFAH